MKNELTMPSIKNVKGIETDLVKLAYKLLSNGALIEESIIDRKVTVSITGEEYTMVLSSSLPKTAVEILHYGYRGFSVSIVDVNNIRIQYHSDAHRETVQALGRLIDDIYNINQGKKAEGVYKKFEEFLND